MSLRSLRLQPIESICSLTEGAAALEFARRESRLRFPQTIEKAVPFREEAEGCVMKCQSCPSPATLHITEITKGVPTEHHYCEECAQKYLSQADDKESDLPDGVAAEADEESEGKLKELDRLVCPNCGITFKEFRKQGRLGCPHDYIAFRDELLPLLESIHGETQHFGKVPKRTPDDSQKQFRLIKLRNELRVAIAEESYEHAARIRDEIQSLENGTDPKASNR